MIESPMWLANRGKTKRCLSELKKIAKVNKTELSDNLKILLNKDVLNKDDKIYGALGLFSSWKLTKISTLVIIGW